MHSKLWNFKYCTIILINISMCFSFYMITSILMIYLVGIGVSLSGAGAIIGIFSITSLLIRPFVGYITDRYNKKILLMLGSLLVGVSVIAYVLTVSFPTIIIFRIIHGFAFGINSTAIVAMASEYIPTERFNEGIGYLGIGQIIA